MNPRELRFFESLSDWEFFFFNTQSFWGYLFIAFLIVRVFCNHWIYQLIDSGLVNPNISNHKIILPQSYNDIEKLKKRYPTMKNPTVDGGDDARFLEFLIICVFTFWWGKDLGDTEKSIRVKKIANVLNLIFIPLLVFVIVLFFHLQEANLVLDNFDKDWFYFLK